MVILKFSLAFSFLQLIVFIAIDVEQLGSSLMINIDRLL